ncbi:hypothetical protein P691DRAFT_517398 [Macrolepiota fuliginosa MF-IS2]|uniref:Uncharacterized protein n=1 Tax=Macrolepiota fuliginosa MF-IS2 TaxID=1400762 RepID=A0A9P5WZH0_9AGAR|nr:hypothetical protein P691DRAFT_517398 [Macrolepiota fuliginosa MF-IS2]
MAYATRVVACRRHRYSKESRGAERILGTNSHIKLARGPIRSVSSKHCDAPPLPQRPAIQDPITHTLPHLTAPTPPHPAAHPPVHLSYLHSGTSNPITSTSAAAHTVLTWLLVSR